MVTPLNACTGSGQRTHDDPGADRAADQKTCCIIVGRNGAACTETAADASVHLQLLLSDNQYFAPVYFVIAFQAPSAIPESRSALCYRTARSRL